MKKLLINIGRFFRLIDERSVCLSLTNIAVMVVVAKVATTPSPSFADLGALLGVLFAYYGKKHINKDLDQTTEDQKADMAELKTKVKEVGDRIGGVAAMVGIKNVKQ